MALLVARKVYWQTKVAGGPVWIGDPTEALFLETSPAQILEVAQKLPGQGLMTPPGRMGVSQCIPDGASRKI